jgi:hypothetical protein
MRDQLAQLIEDPQAFRAAIAGDLRVQRAFFNFKNDQATRAIHAWLEQEGITG